MPTTPELFVGSTDNLNGNLGSFFSLDVNMRFNTKDGYYYDMEKIKYTCNGSEGHYTNMQDASIVEPHKEEDSVNALDINAMVE